MADTYAIETKDLVKSYRMAGLEDGLLDVVDDAFNGRTSHEAFEEGGVVKTVVVETVRLKLHPVYKKYVRVRNRYKAHDEKNECRVGDRVEIAEHRPLSRDKRWIVVRVIERAVQE